MIVARHKGCLSSEESKSISKELESLGYNSYKFNFDFLRVIEMLICRRIVEQICSYDPDVSPEDKVVTVEIPLLGDLVISARTFHERHRLTEKPSIHFEWTFIPSSGFKTDVSAAFFEKKCPITEAFNRLYGSRLKDIYERLRNEQAGMKPVCNEQQNSHNSNKQENNGEINNELFNIVSNMCEDDIEQLIEIAKAIKGD